MDGHLKKEIVIGPSYCDHTAKLGIENTFALLMDLAAEHADLLGVGSKDFIPRGLFWLTVRTRIRFFSRPSMGETVQADTWPEPPGSRRYNRDYRLTVNGETCVEGKTEWAILDRTTGRLAKLDQVYPPQLEPDAQTVFSNPFSVFEPKPKDAQLVGTYVVNAADVDLGNHMNNTAYIRALHTLFHSDEWKTFPTGEWEVIYRSQCFEGERLTIWKTTTEEQTIFYYQKDDDSTAFILSIRP